MDKSVEETGRIEANEDDVDMVELRATMKNYKVQREQPALKSLLAPESETEMTKSFSNLKENMEKSGVHIFTMDDLPQGMAATYPPYLQINQKWPYLLGHNSPVSQMLQAIVYKIAT